MKPSKAQTNRIEKIMRTILISFGYILTALLVLAFGLPIVLLPLSTPVPAWIWVPLGIAYIALIVAVLRLRTWKVIVTGIAGMLLVAILAVVISQALAFTPPITDANGNPLPNSIASLEKVNLNGSEQWISIRGKDMDKPVLLFLAGGPGGSQLVTARRALGGLEEHFVVVNWEQPGAGKSFDAVNRQQLSPERYVKDGIALVNHLRERFGEEKVYLLGESWGSALGVWMVQRNPELFHAFIGTGQMVAFLENDLMCYDFVLKLMEERGHAEKVEQLKQQGPPPYYGNGVAMKEAAFLMETFNYMNADSNIADDGFNTFQDLAGSEYGLYDKVSWFRGALETMDVVYPQLWEVDFRVQATQLEVPVYFFLGRHDVNAPPVLAEEYFELLNAPHKELIWFERSGHNPWVTESALFVDAVVNEVLAETFASND
ncbi:MAG: alpha/beta hydrolase [Anaerolineales bacterium]|nr:alpha/beta hydrolase [Anaerolineales bacterium]